MAKALSFHAGYRCRNSGVCCRAAWNLPFEPEDRAAAERLHLVRGAAFEEREGTFFAARRSDGACVFLESSGGERELCGIHRAAGHASLPVTCRMFPRVGLQDARGTQVSLSHYCPTAAAMLVEFDGQVEIVHAPESLTDVGPLDGLDAREALPPLLRDGILMDLDSFALWEGRAIELLSDPALEARAAVKALADVTSAIVAWSPGTIPLASAVEAAFENGPSGKLRGPVDRTALACKRWLAAHLFANWIAYQGRGLLTIVRYVRACLDVLTVELARDGNILEAIRRSDYLIVHESDSQQLARSLDAVVLRHL